MNRRTTWLLAVLLTAMGGSGEAVTHGSGLAATDGAGEAAAISSPETFFDGREAWWADSVLASPEFAGRRSGSPGGTAAENWIAARFAAAGLRPGAKDGTFFQSFPVIGLEAKKAVLELLNGTFGRVRFVLGEDYVLLLTPAAGDIAAEAVLVGYGIDQPSKGRDDYAGCDLRGKIAVILRGRPEDGQDWEREYRRTHTFAAARAHGARAVLYYQGEEAVAGAALAAEIYDPAVPAGYIGEPIVRMLLRETGWNLEEVQGKLKKGAFPIATGKRLRFKCEVKGPPVATGRNVLGMIRGSDPVLGSEVVIFGAHHDHIGRDAGGHLYPGANDNASGTSVVIEMARAARAAGWRPRRTVLFVTFGGEELGLLGSRHMASDLPFDSTRCAAMLNLDMVGQGDGGFGLAGGSRLGSAYLAWRAALDSTRAGQIEERRLSGEYSDYAPFAEHGIPALGAWSRGQHGRWHDVEDHSRSVSPEVLASVGRGLASLLVAIADWPQPLADGLGHERGIRADALQICFPPWDAARIGDPAREALDGGGRLAGRLVALDPAPGAGSARGTGEETLRRLGQLRALAGAKSSWLSLATSFGDVGESWDQMRFSILPVMNSASLDRIGPDATRSLCAAGLAGAISAPASGLPSRETCEALATEKRPLITGTASPWGEILTREPELRILLLWDRTGDRLPVPPDSTRRSRILFVLPVDGLADSARVREAVTQWGDKHLHIDIAAGLETGVPDPESLRFIRWLRHAGWPASRIEACLGGNLRNFR